jgi:putrescine transport system substrate-binding protein
VLVWADDKGRFAIRQLTKHVIGLLLISVAPLSGCGRSDSFVNAKSTSAGGVVNLYIWADDIAPDTLSSFEKQTGIKVNISYFDSPEMLESRMLTGNSGVDVAVPTAAFIQRHIRSGAYLMLDKTKLPNLSHLDPTLMSRVAGNDPGNSYGVIYSWGTMGIGYNKAMISKILPDVFLDSWKLIFDPALAGKLANCGINLMDDPVGVVRMVLVSMGRSPNDLNPQNLSDVAQVLSKIRPFIRNIDTSSQIEALANGDLCLAVAYNGNVVQASKRAKDARNGNEIDYLIPKEGSLLWFDLLAIPKDAPHPANAYRFINYIMEPSVVANITNATGYANANKDAIPLLEPSLVEDPAIYPTADQQQRLFVQSELTTEQSRAITRLWQQFKTQQ